jgi:hypothetical protein
MSVPPHRRQSSRTTPSTFRKPHATAPDAAIADPSIPPSSTVPSIVYRSSSSVVDLAAMTAPSKRSSKQVEDDDVEAKKGKRAQTGKRAKKPDLNDPEEKEYAERQAQGVQQLGREGQAAPQAANERASSSESNDDKSAAGTRLHITHRHTHTHTRTHIHHSHTPLCSLYRTSSTVGVQRIIKFLFATVTTIVFNFISRR